MNAATGSERENWLEAMRRELDAMNQLGVLCAVEESGLRGVKNSDILPAKCVFGIKKETKHKVRLVVCGNFTSKYTGPVSTHAVDAPTLRMILAMAEAEGWDIDTADINTAFLRASFPEGSNEYYMRVPSILVKYGLVPAGTVWRLCRPMYGLREAPRCWGITRDAELKKLKTKNGLTLIQSSADPSLWSIMDGEKRVGFLITYVDDFLIVGKTGTNEEIINAIANIW